MRRKAYSAGAVKFGFWFAELCKTVQLLRSGKSIGEIKALSENENIFAAATPTRARQIYATVSARASSLTDEYYDIFIESSIETQKIIALISIMNTDALFFDFMNEVYREKLMTGDTFLNDADFRVFFLAKQRESEKVAAWTDQTLDRLRQSYKAYLAESGLIERGAGTRKIKKPLIDGRLASLLSESGMGIILQGS